MQNMTLEKIISHLLIPALCLAMPFLSFSQQVIVNSQGEKIVIYPDGSWRHYEAADSTLIRQKSQREDLIKMPEREADPHERLTENKLDAEEFQRQSQAFIRALRQEESDIRKELRTATTNKFDTDTQLKQAYENKDIVEPDLLASLEVKKEQETEAVKYARKKLQKVTKILQKADKLQNKDPEKGYAYLQKLQAKYQTYQVYAKQTPATEDASPVAGILSPREEKAPVKTTENIPVAHDPVPHSNPASWNMDDQIRKWMGAPPTGYASEPSQCTFVTRDLDGEGNITKQELEKTLIFTHTDDELRPYFGDDELVTCSASMLQVGDQVYLNMDFRIASPNAMKNFGPLKSGSLLRIKLLNGIFVNLYNMRQDGGRIDPYSGHTLYSGRYLVGNPERRSLERSGVEYIRVVWGTGFEDYPVYALDFFKHQFACLEKPLN